MEFRTYKTRNGLAPDLGPIGLPVELNFESVNSTFDLDFTKTIQDRNIDIIQSVWVDNADNPNKLVIQCDQTKQRIIVPANSQNSFPIIHPQDPRMTISCDGVAAFAGKVQLIFQNVPVPIASWGNISIANVIATLVPTIAAVADHSGAIAVGGTSQIAIPANAARKRFTIQNPGNAPASITINFGAAATFPATNSLELFPGGSYDTQFGPLDLGDIQVNAPNGGQIYVAKEWS